MILHTKLEDPAASKVNCVGSGSVSYVHTLGGSGFWISALRSKPVFAENRVTGGQYKATPSPPDNW